MELSVDGATHVVDIDAVVVAGFTGRDEAAVREHVDELVAQGIPAPPSIPMFWCLPPWVAVQGDRAVVAAATTSGEAEVCVVADGDDTWLTVGSDHTDRAVEAVDMALSKQVCPKMIGRAAWPLAAVRDRLDRLELRSWVDEGGGETEYQLGSTGALRSPLELLERLPFPGLRRFAMLCGTVPAIGGIRPAGRFRAELADPASGDALPLGYSIEVLPQADLSERSAHGAHRS